jgi:cysteine desulfurase/selenocysteine lyase
MSLYLQALRSQFPILSKTIGGKPLAYLDNAATAQKPEAVLHAMDDFYRTANANVHRGLHPLAEAATQAYEDARTTVRGFLHAAHDDDIVFTKSCTEAINLVARSFVEKGDTIVLSVLEHHSNIVPWMQRNATLRWIDIDDQGDLRMEELDRHLQDGGVKLVTVTGLSNVLGIRLPLKTIIDKAHTAGALVLVDAAQLVAHAPIDVQELDCDFLAFSGHKLYGPLGIGVLYGKRTLLKNMPPFLGGGMMIGEVTTTDFTPADPPARFEGGTPNVAGAVGLAAAIRWLGQYSWKDIEAHELRLLHAAADGLRSIPDVHLLGPNLHTGCLCFTIDGVHPHDLAELLGREGICIRAGHHCCQPLHRRLGISASTRLSVGIYNTIEEIERVAPAIEECVEKMRIEN